MSNFLITVAICSVRVLIELNFQRFSLLHKDCCGFTWIDADLRGFAQ